MKWSQYYYKLLAWPQGLAICSLSLGLAACADSQIMDNLTAEPPAGMLAKRADVLRDDSTAARWPNLATVPPRPANVLPLSARQQELKKLSAEREAGLKLLPKLMK